MRLTVFDQVNTLKSLHDGLQDSVREMAINYDILRNRIGSISDKIISQYLLKVKALSRGVSDFPLGMVGEKTQGMLLFTVRILGIGLSSARKAGDVTVALLVNNVEIPECMGFLTKDRRENMTTLIFHLR